MFIHNFKYALKILFRKRMLIFWTFAFPILLGTFFKMAFSDIESGEKLETINIAIVNNSEFENNKIYKMAFETLSNEYSSDRLFNTKYVTEEEAKSLLDKEEISGYLKLENETPELTFKDNGINQTILKYVTEEIAQTSDIKSKQIDEDEISKIFSETIIKILNGQKDIDYKKIMESLSNLVEPEARINNISNNNLSYTMIEFYTLIAMACLYGGMLGAEAINQNLANMSNQGKRVAVAPLSKLKVVLSSTLAAYITQLVGVALLFIYTIFVLKVDYGNNLGLVILLAISGSLAGLAIGLAVSTILKANEGAKIGIIIGVTMLGCYLAGMMGITMKYTVDKNMPIINKLNPASMITDGFYALYYYDTLDRFTFDCISLLIFAFVLIVISYFSLRRQKYDSI